MNGGCQDRLYRNLGNPGLLDLLDKRSRKILDVGCGAGDNAKLLRRRDPAAKIYGITVSPEEASAATPYLEGVWVCDVEKGFPAALIPWRFDAIIFSHVLEHLRDPARTVAQAVNLLADDGDLLIAVPNVVSWRQRWKLILGQFEYEQSGVMDETHLRFFTFLTADRYLLGQTPQLDCVEKKAEGSVPLWFLRRYVFPASLGAAIDRLGVRFWPNLFGAQILIRATRRNASQI